MKPLKIFIAATSALLLASCSAGQITQTSDQVAAVDGASVNSSDNTIAVRDVTIHVTKDGETGVKFTAINQDKKRDATHKLEKITIDGQEVAIDGTTEFKAGCNLVGGDRFDAVLGEQVTGVTHVTTTADNPGFPLGGTKDVVFDFDSGQVTARAAVAAPVLESGKVNRQTGAEAHHESETSTTATTTTSAANSE